VREAVGAQGGWGREGEEESWGWGVAKVTDGLVLCGFGVPFARWETESSTRYSPRQLKREKKMKTQWAVECDREEAFTVPLGKFPES
jgi:hypothetical protein